MTQVKEDAPRRKWLPGAVLAAGLGILAVTATAFALPSDAPKPDATPATFDYASSERFAAAPVPSKDLQFYESIDPASLRLLAEDSEAQYWSALNDEGRLCIVASVGQSESLSASCATPEEFKERGVATRLLTQSYAVEAYLVPDVVASKIGSNLIVADPFDADRSGADVSVDGFKLFKLPPVEDEDIPTGLLVRLES